MVSSKNPIVGPEAKYQPRKVLVKDATIQQKRLSRRSIRERGPKGHGRVQREHFGCGKSQKRAVSRVFVIRRKLMMQITIHKGIEANRITPI